MIQINLLPSDERASKRKISLPTISGGAVLWVALGIFVYAGAVAGIWVLQSRKITDYETKISGPQGRVGPPGAAAREDSQAHGRARRSQQAPRRSSRRSTRIVTCTCA